MTAEIAAPAEMIDALRRFIADESIDLDVACDAPGAVRVAPSGPERRDSDLETLYAGGRISCQTGRAMAKKLGIDPGDIGKLANHLDIKIHGCVLGCFR